MKTSGSWQLQMPVPLAAVHVALDWQPGELFIQQHDYFVICVLVAGTGHYRVADCCLPATAPWFTLIAPGEVDEVGLDGPMESWYIAFHWPGLHVRPGKRPNQVHITAGNRSAHVPRWQVPDGATTARLIRLFADIRDYLDRRDLAGELAARAALLQIFSQFMEQQTEATVDLSTHRGVHDFKELLEHHACDPMPLEALTAASGVTPGHLRVLFRKQYGMSPGAYRTLARMTQARDLLTTTSLNVAEVARRIGYPDALYFSRLFRRHFGFPPSRLIRQPRGSHS